MKALYTASIQIVSIIWVISPGHLGRIVRAVQGTQSLARKRRRFILLTPGHGR